MLLTLYMSDRYAILEKLSNFEKKYNLNQIAKIPEMDQKDLHRMKIRVIMRLIRQGHV